MLVERRGRVIAVEHGPTGGARRSPKVQRKAAAFARWHEPDDARFKSGSVRGSGCNSPGLLGMFALVIVSHDASCRRTSSFPLTALKRDWQPGRMHAS
jgi:hypothetical protein